MLGLIARADNSGLGIQCWEFARHMNPDRVLVIDVGHLYDETAHCNKRTFLDRYPGALVHTGWTPHRHLLNQFCAGLDVIFTAETTYSPELVTAAHHCGARVVVQYNYEFLAHQLYNYPQPDVFAAPSQWNWDTLEVPNRTHLPVPIATDRFAPRESNRDGKRHFLHIVGRPATHDRNGTPDLLAALPHVTADIQLTLTCQDVAYLAQLDHHDIPENVELVVETGDVNNYWDLYRGDVMIMPRRFGGLCLPAQEALGAGMPVVMPDVDPNNRWLPQEWLVPATRRDQFAAVTPIDVYHSNPRALAAIIDRFATDLRFYDRACARAARLRDQLSWDALKSDYDKILAAC
jgi:glycosyltransferase involved in cell wall biosynthesis